MNSYASDQFLQTSNTPFPFDYQKIYDEYTIKVEQHLEEDGLHSFREEDFAHEEKATPLLMNIKQEIDIKQEVVEKEDDELTCFNMPNNHGLMNFYQNDGVDLKIQPDLYCAELNRYSEDEKPEDEDTIKVHNIHLILCFRVLKAKFQKSIPTVSKEMRKKTVSKPIIRLPLH